MIGMKHLPYGHERMQSLPGWLFSWLYGRLIRLAGTSSTGRAGRQRRRRLLIAGAVCFTLVLEGVMLWMLSELVGLCISLFELYVELAQKHLEITLDQTP